MSTLDDLLTILGEIEFPLQSAHSGSAIFIFTAANYVDLSSGKRVPSKKPHAAAQRQNDRISRILKLHRERCRQAGYQGNTTERQSLMRELKLAAPYAMISSNLEEVAQAMALGYATGDLAYEPMFGRDGVLWLMGNRM